MLCPLCRSTTTRVVDSRLTEPGDAIRRRRECGGCGGRFTTYERAEGAVLTVRKRDGRVEDFDRDKLLRGLLRAATKRPLPVPALEAVVESIAAEAGRAGGRIEAERVGEMALRALIATDRVAAIRFASVYRNFEDLDEFDAELRRLGEEPAPTAGQLDLEAAAGGPVPSDARRKVQRPSAARQRAAGAPDSKRRGHVEHP